jgi:hypothetical protein
MFPKKIKLIASVGLLVLAGAGRLCAQTSSDLRINELLVYNDSNYVDDYGIRSPWIEIFNSAYNTVNLGGMFLTDDLSNPTKYLILKGQNITKIPQRSYLVFWADNNTTRGILHLNFGLEPGKTIALFEANGKTLIDSVTIPRTIGHDTSYGRLMDGSPDWGILEKTTPKSNNNTKVIETSGDQFLKFDPFGSAMAIIAMSVVFFGLAALYFFFKAMSRILSRDIKKQLHARSLLKAKAGVVTGSDHREHAGLQITGEINAAIAMTLHLYSSELHDAENTVLTINKVSRTYSPWSSKIYGLRKSPK